MRCPQTFQGFSAKYGRVIDELPLTTIQRKIIKTRYIDEVSRAETAHLVSSVLYHTLFTITALSSILVTSLMSLEKISMLTHEAAEGVFWTGWVLSIAVVIGLKLLYGSGIAKRYATGADYLERFYTEGWQYAAKIGPYKVADLPGNPDSFSMFMTNIEALKKKAASELSEIRAEAAAALTAQSPPMAGNQASSAGLPVGSPVGQPMGQPAGPLAGTPAGQPIDTVLGRQPQLYGRTAWNIAQINSSVAANTAPVDTQDNIVPSTHSSAAVPISAAPSAPAAAGLDGGHIGHCDINTDTGPGKEAASVDIAGASLGAASVAINNTSDNIVVGE